jgi:hypothetical protein
MDAPGGLRDFANREVPMPQGVIGFAVFTSPGVKPAFFTDQGRAVDYATRVGGVWFGVVCAKRRTDEAT